MTSYLISNKAVEDLNEIWEFTFVNWSEEQADSYYNFLINQIQEIAITPGIGKKYPTINPDILGFIAKSHIIFYRITDSEQIEVVRILHARMDVNSVFTK